MKRTVTEQDLARLKKQREENDGRYDEALTNLDAAVQSVPEFPHPPPVPDETQVTPLNSRWEILRLRPPLPPGWRTRIARFVWGLFEPVLAEQQAFNSLVVDHVNRNIQPQREIVKSIETTISTLREQVERLVVFESQLILYLQRITAFVNSKDYEFAALARRAVEDAYIGIESLDRTQRALTSAIQALSDQTMKYAESMGAKSQRFDARIEDVRSALGVSQQHIMTLHREVERFTTGPSVPVATAPGIPAPAVARAPAPDARTSTLAGDAALDSWKYTAFEAQFRGSPADIRKRLLGYVPVFAGHDDVLDVGCGRGEFVELLRDAGIGARGIDLNYEMVEVCRARGLDAEHADALAYMRSLGDASLGGVFAAQVVEHLQPDYLLQLLDEAQRTLRPGSPIVLETINVACWLAYFESYVRDITHAKPLHPDTLKYLVVASGFRDVEVRFSAPVPSHLRLQRTPELVRMPSKDRDEEPIHMLANAFNANMDLLNRHLFTHLDYAVIGRRA